MKNNKIIVILLLLATSALGIYALYRSFGPPPRITTPLLIVEILAVILPLVAAALIAFSKKE